MPGRRLGGRPLQVQAQQKPKKSQRKQKKRAQNALSIAETQYDDSAELNRNRRGEYDQGPKKRQREDDEEPGLSDEDEGGQRKRAKSSFRARYGETAEFGSDSEGNEWVVGQVEDEDDESLNSDEAFGESDEERFEGFTFRGSKSRKPKQNRRSGDSNILDEGEPLHQDSEDADSEAESENFAEHAVDLHTMLDNDSDEEEEVVRSSEKAKKDSQSLESNEDESDLASGFEDEDSDSQTSSRSELSLGDESEDDDDDLTAAYRSRALQNMVANLGNGDTSDLVAEKERAEAQEKLAPTGIVAQSGGLEDLLEALDPATRKLLGAAVKPVKKAGKGIPGKVEVPLPQRQQARLDRAAAYEKSKETLARWIETVKRNRQAEHLSFPLLSQDEASAKNAAVLQPLDGTKPFNELEAMIQSILVENGMKVPGGESQEESDDDLKLEGAPVSTLSLAEVLEKRAELRKARDLVFREEIKAKRIKKIKSKAYRRVHRKARERGLQRQQEADAENGILPDEDDQERLDRLRAEERMGAKHRESKWAKAMKSTGRTAWDEEARNGMLDMARREEELKRRILGQGIRADGSADEESSSADDDDDEEEDDQKLQDKLFRLRESPQRNGSGSRLANMAFMQRAEAEKRRENEQTIAQIQRDLDGEDTLSESDAEGPARRSFGTRKDLKLPLNTKIPAPKNEFEEASGSEREDFEDGGDEIQVTIDRENKRPNGDAKSRPSDSIARRRGGVGRLEKQTSEPEEGLSSANDWLDPSPADLKQPRQKSSKQTDVLADVSLNQSGQFQPLKKAYDPPKQLSRQVRLLPSRSKKAKEGDEDDRTSSSGSESDASAGTSPRLTEREQQLKQAFAGDEVVASFAAEKAEQAALERTPSPEADVLPGWGSWAGAGLSKRDRRERARHAARAKERAAAAVLVPGSGKGPAWMAERKGAKNGRKVDRTRRDANLDRVILSEKRVAKTARYLAQALPHPFETRAQYERSLRVPVGPEWTTKETFQGGTKPRILLGGGIIKPMEKPTI